MSSFFKALEYHPQYRPGLRLVFLKAQKYNLKTHYSNYDNISTYNEHGYSDYSKLLEDYDNAYEIANQKAGEILTQNLQDQTAQSGMALAGWNPKKHDMEAQAVDWWKWGMFSFYFDI
jgi:polyamine oxidase